MVLLHMKKSEEHQFLYETTVEIGVRQLIQELCEVHNLRLQIQRLKLEGEELAKYGPAKHPDKQGLDEEVEGMKGMTLDDGPKPTRGPFYKPDPTGRRTGEACDPEVAKVLFKTLQDAEEAASKKLVERKVALTAAALRDAIQNILGAVMICYPMGLPEYDLVRECLDGTEDLAGTSYALDVLDPESSTLWFCGKQVPPEKQLKDSVGKNEKTKVVVKLQKKGAGAPTREPIVDAETQKAMMAFYYKKQEEAKRLEGDDEDAFTNSAWANPKSLKAQFAGTGQGIRFR
eukprot:jgi/Mesvir1/4955/Mv11448-RA.1